MMKIFKGNIMWFKKKDPFTPDANHSSYNNAVRENCERDVKNSRCCIDFDKLNVFSIERRMVFVDYSYQNVTILGYFVNGDVEPHEWELYCGEVEHDNLVTEFKSSIKK